MDQRQAIALFRYQIIAPLLVLPADRGLLKKELLRLADRSWEHPTRGTVTIGFGTIQEWLYRYKRDGLDGLLPAERYDRGKSRVIDDATAELIEKIVQANPALTGRVILAELAAARHDAEGLPSLRALYRFLRARDLRSRFGPQRQDHRAYQFDLAGDCWQADIMYGPSLPTADGVRRRTYLFAILDDATRLVAHGQFYFEQHLRGFKDCLKQALLKRGLPRRLYCDNGKVFRSRLILLLAARLGIQLIHSRPFKPQGRAKIERFFRRVRTAFLVRVDPDRVGDLDELNRLFAAWLEGEYHVTPHRGIDDETPLDRWMRLAGGIRSLPPGTDLDELFLEETSRRVGKDGTLRINGRVFEVGPDRIGQRVTVCYDPFDLRRVLVIGTDKRKAVAYPVDLAGNRYVRRRTSEGNLPPPSAPLSSLQNLAERREGDGASETEARHDD